MDYTRLLNKEIKWGEFAEQYSVAELKQEMQRLYDETLSLLEQATDADMTFVPHDPEANDPYAETEAEQHIGWTLGHLVAHVTASNEESAVFSSLLARGIPQGGRIRVETPWEQIDTVAAARQRLMESRRIVNAYLAAWPDNPDFETLRVFGSERAQEYFGPIDAKAAIVMGLSHHYEHISQMKATLAQAQAATRETV